MMPLKYILSLLLLAAIFVAGFSFPNSKKFPVVYVSGTVINAATKKPVNAGDKISIKTNILFNSDTSFILIIGNNHVIKLREHNFRNNKPTLSNEFSCSQFVSETLEDSTQFYPFKLLNDSLLFFKSTQHVSINPLDYQLKENNFLIIQLEKANNSFTRKISFDGTTIILDKPSYFQKDTSLHISKINILHYNSSMNSYKLMYTYYPYSLTKAEVEKIMQTTYAILTKLFSGETDLINQFQNEIMIELAGICPKRNY